MSGNYRIKSLQIFRAKHVSLPFQGVNSIIQEIPSVWVQVLVPSSARDAAVGRGQGSSGCCHWAPELSLPLQLLVPLSHLRQGRGEPGSREGGKSCEEQPWELPSQSMRQGRRCWSRSWFHLSAVRRGSVSSQPTTGVMSLHNITNFTVNKAEIHTNLVVTLCNFAFARH